MHGVTGSPVMAAVGRLAFALLPLLGHGWAQGEAQGRFLVSAVTTTTTLSTATLCYTAAALTAPCRRRRRELPTGEQEGILPTFLDETPTLSSSLEPPEDVERKGRFLFYWRTTTYFSTSTSYTATTTLSYLECTPSGFPMALCGR
jgi:hypothetical protein